METTTALLIAIPVLVVLAAPALAGLQDRARAVAAALASERRPDTERAVQRIVMEYFSTKGQEATEKYFWKNAKAAYKWISHGVS